MLRSPRPISAFISPNLRRQLSTDDTRTLTITRPRRSGKPNSQDHLSQSLTKKKIPHTVRFATPDHHLCSIHLLQMRIAVTLRRDHAVRAPLLLLRHGNDAPHGDRRRLTLQGQTDPWVLPPIRRLRSCHRRHGGRDHEER